MFNDEVINYYILAPSIQRETDISHTIIIIIETAQREQNRNEKKKKNNPKTNKYMNAMNASSEHTKAPANNEQNAMKEKLIIHSHLYRTKQGMSHVSHAYFTRCD